MTTLRYKLCAIAASVCAVLQSMDVAAAQEIPRNGIDDVRFDVHLDLGWYGAFGTGFRVEFPVVPEGFIPRVPDEFAITTGGELFLFTYNDYYDEADGIAVAPLVAGQWNFYLHPKWSVFSELGIAMLFGDYGHRHHNPDRHVFVDAFLGVGGRYHWNDRNALLMRISWPAGFQFGITF